MPLDPTLLTFALVTVLLALVLALVDGVGPGVRPDHDLGWAEDIEAATDHLDPQPLAEALLDRPDSVIVVDLRPAAEFTAWHLPGARNLSVPEVFAPANAALFRDANRTVVFVSEAMPHAAQAWVEARRRGATNARVLAGGLARFRNEILMPPSLRGETSEARAQAEAAFWRRARTAFGLPRAAAGAPQEAPPAPPKAGRYATDPATLDHPTVVSVTWVQARLGRVILFDTREKPDAYEKGHLPGARHVPLATFRGTIAGVPEEVLPPEELATRAGGLGVGPESDVVVYGDERLQDPLGVLLALAAVGHPRVAFMEGGVRAWKSAGFTFETTVPEAPVAVTLPVRPPLGLVRAAAKDVLAASRAKTPMILDVRPAPAFRGEQVTEARGGHVPGAKNRPYTDDVVIQDDGVWLRAREDLAKAYAAMGLDGKTPVIVMCRTGHQASQTWFLLKTLLGHDDVRWYDGSWKEWAGKPELPTETGETKGS